MQSNFPPANSAPSALRSALAQDRKLEYSFDQHLLAAADPYRSREISLRRLDAAISTLPDRYACVGSGRTGDSRQQLRHEGPRGDVARDIVDAPPQKTLPQLVDASGNPLRPEQYRTDMSWILPASQLDNMGLAIRWTGISDALQDVSTQLGIDDHNNNTHTLDATLQCVVACPRDINLDGRQLFGQQHVQDENDATNSSKKDTLTLVALCESGAISSSGVPQHLQPTATVSFGLRGEQGQEFLYDATGPGSYAAWYNSEEASVTFPTADALMVVYGVTCVPKKESSGSSSAVPTPRAWCAQSTSSLSSIPPEVGSTIKAFLGHKALYHLKATCHDMHPTTGNQDVELMSAMIRECRDEIEESCQEDESGKTSLGLLLNHTYNGNSSVDSSSSASMLRGRDAILFDAMKLAYPSNQVKIQEGVMRVEQMTSKETGLSKRRVMVLQDTPPGDAAPTQDLLAQASRLAQQRQRRRSYVMPCPAVPVSSIEELSCAMLPFFGNVEENYDLGGKKLYPVSSTSFLLSQERVGNIIGLKDSIDTTTLYHRDGDRQVAISYYRCAYVSVDLLRTSTTSEEKSAVAVVDTRVQATSLADRILPRSSVCWVDSRRGSLLEEEFGESLSSSPLRP